MTFDEFGLYLEKLEQTSSRLSLIGILSDLFSHLSDRELPQAAYLIQGRVAPFYQPIEIGMAEKSVAAAIARALGVSREKILQEYSKVGDLGKVIEQYKKEGPSQKLKPTISEVFEKLLQIAQTSGDGTVEKKISTLSGLMIKVNKVGAKHLARIPLGRSRLGVGDPTILEAFALAKFGDRKNRQILEEAYNKTSDLGLIGETLWQQGLEGVAKLSVSVGRPIRSQLAERLPDPQKVLEKFGGEAHVQFKYDGFRVQIHKDGESIRLFSRNLEETTVMFPDLIEGALQQIKAKSVILDSEALAYNPESEEFLPFQETTKRRRKYGIAEMQKQLPLRAFVFDIMYFNGHSLIDLPLIERLKYFDKAIFGDEVLIPQKGEVSGSAERITLLFNEALSQGLEGLIIKRPDSKYEAGARNFNWVKLKKNSSGELKDTIDCVILGYIFGKGKRAQFGAGALLVGVYDKAKDEFVTVSKIGTGLTDEEWREIHKRADKIKIAHKPARVNSNLMPSVWIKPEIVIEVLADEITRSPIHTAGASAESNSNQPEPGYALRFPRLVKFRGSDKRAEDATTVKELIEMYKQQFSKK